MTMNDPRTPLNQSYRLTLEHRDYVIQEVIGFGGSCLAYYADRKPNKHELKIGMPTVPTIVKEFYPLELDASITRAPSGELCVTATTQSIFDLMKSGFENGVAKQAAFCVSDSNHTLPLPDLASQNGTTYTAVALTYGQTLTKCAGTLSPLEKADVITSLRNAVMKLHDNGKLYLDLKPSNVFVFKKEQDESRRVALFDFDTVVAVNDITSAVISFSEGWSPNEQTNLLKEEISYTADVYAIGAVYYWMLSGKKVSDSILDEIVRGRFGFLDEIDELRSNKWLKESVEQVLSATLKRLPGKRVQRVADIPL